MTIKQTLLTGAVALASLTALPPAPAQSPGSHDVPVDGFWSGSVYNTQKYFKQNPFNAYSLNNITAKKGADGSVSLQFGGCDGKIPNCLPIINGWNYVVRLYRPRADILNGTSKFPEAQPRP
jgi:hypothetical protein